MYNNNMYFTIATRYFWCYYKYLGGKAFQKKIGKLTDIGASYISEIMRGKKGGTEEIRRKIVDGIKRLIPQLEVIKGLNYNDFFEFGKYLHNNSSVEVNWYFSNSVPIDIKKWLVERNIKDENRLLDTELLAHVVSSLENVISEENLKIPIEKKSQIIALVHNEMAGINWNKLETNLDNFIQNNSMMKLYLKLAS